MGTRADFYIGRGTEAEWLGSIAWDGNPVSVLDSETSVGGTQALTATTEADFRDGVTSMQQSRDDFTSPSEGWPWPWADSASSDYAYAFDGDQVYVSKAGEPWMRVELDRPFVGPQVLNLVEDEATQEVVFPGMRDRRRVRYDRGSGLIKAGVIEHRGHC